jgi:hypothetical protein
MRIAIVTYFFRPGDEIGGMRPFALAKNLAATGHDVLVLTRQPSPTEEAFRAVTVSAGASGLPGGDAGADDAARPAGLVKRFLRTALAIPDGKNVWALRAAHALRRESRERPFDAIVTTGPPHSAHLVARWVIRRGEGTRWIADMRDLWTDNPYYDYGRLRKPLDAVIENRVLGRADAIAAATDGFRRAIVARHAPACTAIYTGYDDTASPPAVVRASGASKLVFAHAGNLYGGRRDPTPMLEAVRELYDDGSIAPGDLVLDFMGEGQDSVVDAASRLGVEGFVEAVPHIPREEVMARLARADVLLLVQWRSELTATEVPGKLYEYLALRKPILALGTAPEGELAGILARTGVGRVVNSVDECRVAIEALLEDVTPATVESELAELTQTRMTENFTRVIERVLAVAG